MTDPHAESLPVVETAAPCRHLRSKGMYVYDGETADEHDPSNAIYWCLQSMKNYGPDDQHVDYDSCCNPARPCYQPT